MFGKKECSLTLDLGSMKSWTECRTGGFVWGVDVKGGTEVDVRLARRDQNDELREQLTIDWILGAELETG